MPQIERTLKLDDEKRRTIRRLDPHTSIGRELHHLLDCLEASEARERTAVADSREWQRRACSLDDAYRKLRAAHEPVKPDPKRYSDATIAEMQRRQVKAGFPPFSEETIAKVQAWGPLRRPEKPE